LLISVLLSLYSSSSSLSCSTLSFSPLFPPRCYETFDEGNEFFIVTELVAGGELFDRIVAKTHYTEKEARDLVKMFLETMAYMHEAGVVHRDLKPENLLLCSGEGERKRGGERGRQRDWDM
jgi:serine/threonine protein kinase